jgi:AmmeMemoRadiSam system protein B
MERVKSSNLSGRWYAGDAAALQAQVDDLLAAAGRVERPAAFLGVIAPHAAYPYSGRAAATAYACMAGAPQERAVILAPSHYSWFQGLAWIDVDAFATPLGKVPVDRDSVAALLHQPLCAARPQAFEREHALEIQLPFLQSVLPQVRIVPLLVGEVTAADEQALAAALRPLLDAHTLLVVSSDFVHYGEHFDYLPFPSAGAEAVRAGLRQLDLGAIELVCRGDASGFRRYVEETGATICGRNPIALGLSAPPCGVVGELLQYYTSLDVTGDFEHSVSYAAIALSGRPGPFA